MKNRNRFNRKKEPAIYLKKRNKNIENVAERVKKQFIKACKTRVSSYGTLKVMGRNVKISFDLEEFD